MIVRPRPGPREILFAVRGSIIRRIAPQVALVALAACIAVTLERFWPVPAYAALSVAPFTVVGLALSIFLSFRNGACYERWWEARRQWGHMLTETRGLARELAAWLPGEAQAARRARLLRRAMGFAHALNARLRGKDEAAAAASFLPSDEAARLPSRANRSDAVLAAMGADLAGAARDGALSDMLLVELEARLHAMAGIQAACERIRSTPLPFAYTLLLHRTAWLYCLALPFGLAGTLGWATPFAAAVVAYTFFGLDALGEELEEPFGTTENDLPLDAMVRLIEIDMLDALGAPVPAPLRPRDYLLQ